MLNMLTPVRKLSAISAVNIVCRFSAGWCVLLMAATSGANTLTAAQEAAKQPPTKGTASIAGRVTSGGQPVQGVVVTLLSEESYRRGPAAAQAETNSDGRYLITGVDAGVYQVSPLTPTMVVAGQDVGGPGKSVTLGVGETVEGVDFSVVRGGVITGRVTDGEGRPIIGEVVSVAVYNDQPRRGDRPAYFHNHFTSSAITTDDRGIYRVFGLPAGRYTVSVGEALNSNKRGGRFEGGYFPRTYHRDSTDEAKAEVIEVGEGQEVTGVDIRLAPRAKAYAIAGRVVDAESGRPLPNVPVSYGPVIANSRGMAMPEYGGTSDAKGEFRIKGVIPGRYALFGGLDPYSRIGNANNVYSDPVTVEVGEADAGDLEIKVKPAASIDGTVVLEDSGDKALLARLQGLSVAASVTDRSEPRIPRYNGSRIGLDGHFRIEGLVPGRAQIYLAGPPSESKGFSLLRIERDGVALTSGEVEISSGEQINNLRLVFAYGTGVINGIVKGVGGEASGAGGARTSVSARLVGTGGEDGSSPRVGRYAQADERGRFKIEGLVPGTYEVTAERWVMTPPDAPRQPPMRSKKQNVIVVNGAPAETELSLEPALPEGGPR